MRLRYIKVLSTVRIKKRFCSKTKPVRLNKKRELYKFINDFSKKKFPKKCKILTNVKNKKK